MHEQTFEVDINHAKVDASSSHASSPIGIDDISVQGEFAADAAIRVGPRINSSVYEIPLSLDIAAKVGASVKLSASADIDGTCVSGSAQLQAGLDTRVDVS